MRSRQVILLTLVYFFAIIGIYGFVIWFPTIVQRATNLPNMAVTLLSALPYVAGLAAMIWNGWHSDRTAERRWHTAFPLFLGAGCLAVAIHFSANLPLAFLCMIIVGACTTAFMPSFWALPTAILTESAAAASIGLINSVANLGGFAGPFFIGYLRTLHKLVHAGTGLSSGLHGPVRNAGPAAPRPSEARLTATAPSGPAEQLTKPIAQLPQVDDWRIQIS